MTVFVSESRRRRAPRVPDPETAEERIQDAEGYCEDLSECCEECC